MEELDNKVCRLEEQESHLSGAYIRSLVKQLSTSRRKDYSMTMTPETARRHVKIVDAHPPKQHKKQVRRRLHTSRPYQERLLNMAEARREIVTALKFHRASMKQQPNHPSFDDKDATTNSTTYPSSSCTTKTNFSNDFSYSSFSHPLPNSYTSSPAPPPPPLMSDNFNFMLPNQTLGLNLNVHDFNNLSAALYLHNNSSYSSPSSSSSNSSPPLSIATAVSLEEANPALVDSSGEGEVSGGGLHTAMDDEGMAEMRSLGEQYQMEWNDTMNLVTSAWWFKFFNDMEHGEASDCNNQHHINDNDDAYQILQFPPWLKANDDSCSQDPTLTCMDIGDIEVLAGIGTKSFREPIGLPEMVPSHLLANLITVIDAES
ncbi:myb-like protein I [Senna tora]|uniref:Myb-like protein I n=1 Tax=Senna tora TaxID=362788 RepID=A0A834T8U2_9FABA|nr:myb-like protein I [Senna tora]